jgi:AcrR family transcriptional regulator
MNFFIIPNEGSSGQSARRARILEASMKVFLAYGYQRTTMDQIAQAAEISRPALYVQFRNKADIYRALAHEFMTEALERAKTSLAGGGGSLADRLSRGVGCAMDLMQEVEDAPHGAEILDMRNKLAGDIVASGRARMADLLEGAIRGEGGCCSEFPPRLLADLLLDALDGMKMRGLANAEQAGLLRAYIDVALRAAPLPPQTSE